MALLALNLDFSMKTSENKNHLKKNRSVRLLSFPLPFSDLFRGTKWLYVKSLDKAKPIILLFFIFINKPLIIYYLFINNIYFINKWLENSNIEQY